MIFRLLITLLMIFKKVDGIPIIKDNLKTIQLYDYREISSEEYVSLKTNMDIDTFIENIIHIPLSVDNDIVCERQFENNKSEVIILTCKMWNNESYEYFIDYYDCKILRTILIFGKVIEFNESIIYKCLI
jgi:hypothetical protein